jgi:cell division protein FtsL
MEILTIVLLSVLLILFLVGTAYSIADDIKKIRQLRKRIKEQKRLNEDFKKRHNL